VWRERQRVHPRRADRHPERIDAGVQLRLDPQPGAGASRGDGLDDDFMAGQGSAAPVERDVGEQPVLDLVPLRGAWREVTHRDVQARLGGQFSQLGLPQPVAVAVRASRIGSDQQAPGVRIVIHAAGLPPATDRGDGERRRVVIDTDIDPAGIGGDVVNAVRDGLGNLRTHEAARLGDFMGLSAAAAKDIPRATRVVIHDCGHVPHLEHPGRFLADLLPFLAS
jgi:pimeloyl-ACP methyl ester carboxylesterase